jgi:hypothetical protein
MGGWRLFFSIWRHSHKFKLVSLWPWKKRKQARRNNHNYVRLIIIINNSMSNNYRSRRKKKQRLDISQSLDYNSPVSKNTWIVLYILGEIFSPFLFKIIFYFYYSVSVCVCVCCVASSFFSSPHTSYKMLFTIFLSFFFACELLFVFRTELKIKSVCHVDSVQPSPKKNYRQKKVVWNFGHITLLILQPDVTLCSYAFNPATHQKRKKKTIWFIFFF